MANDSIHHRRSIRLSGYDYRLAETYFITLVTVDRSCLFGSITGDSVNLSPEGQIVAESWQWLAQQYPYVKLDEWVMMPNHFHAILWIDDANAGGSQTIPTSENITTKPLGSLIGAFKTVSTRQINLSRATPGVTVWQRNYYEHIIRNDQALDDIRAYIFNNPYQWNTDQENPLYPLNL